MIEQINQLKQGSIISESSHYIVSRVSGSNAWLTHFESGEEVQIGMSYLKNYTNSADLFETTVKVTKEDKKDGTLGFGRTFILVKYLLYASRSRISLRVRGSYRKRLMLL